MPWEFLYTDFESFAWMPIDFEPFFPGGLAADLRQLCGCSYLGHVAPGSSPGTEKRRKKQQK